jgi:hypothetical protein
MQVVFHVELVAYLGLEHLDLEFNLLLTVLPRVDLHGSQICFGIHPQKLHVDGFELRFLQVVRNLVGVPICLPQLLLELIVIVSQLFHGSWLHHIVREGVVVLLLFEVDYLEGALGHVLTNRVKLLVTHPHLVLVLRPILVFDQLDSFLLDLDFTLNDPLLTVLEDDGMDGHYRLLGRSSSLVLLVGTSFDQIIFEEYQRDIFISDFLRFVSKAASHDKIDRRRRHETCEESHKEQDHICLEEINGWVLEHPYDMVKEIF